MATRSSTEQTRPEPGQILLVVHDFQARSADELSLVKGDRVELIERDDDFGDGWYLGRHLTNGSSGLFPEVYTRPAPRGPATFAPTSSVVKSSTPTPVQMPINQPSAFVDPRPAPSAGPPQTPQLSSQASAPETPKSIGITSPLVTSLPPSESEGVTPTNRSSSVPVLPIGLNLNSSIKNHGPGQDSPVMNETLSVINEHITDMNGSNHTNGHDRRGVNDSGSEYSANVDHRMSYINGSETDEEEENALSEAEVSKWTPDQVAEYLLDVDVEQKHCDVFRDQEISGDVLLGMDQESLFIKEFDLGSVGKRFKTWQKIKSFQDQVKGVTPSTSARNTSNFGSEIGSDDGKMRSRSNTGATVLPRMSSSGGERPGSRQTARHSSQIGSRPSTATSTPQSPTSGVIPESPRQTMAERPSAASIRDMNHSRRHSSVSEFGVGSLPGMLSAAGVGSPAGVHQKQPSFDRNWTMGSASPSLNSRPLSQVGTNDTAAPSDVSGAATPYEMDRGYFSGGEVEGRKRNVLKKRDSNSHSRQSSYTEEQRVRSATTNSRHSRFGSVDSLRTEQAPPSASSRYHGLSFSGRRRTPSAEVLKPTPPPKDVPSPSVTKLEGTPYSPLALSPKSQESKGSPSDWLLPVKSAKQRGFGLRAISDAVTGNEKQRAATDPTLSPSKDSIQSPSVTSSSTPSGGQNSFEMESATDASKSPNAIMTPRKPNTKAKSKKETSAYTRGLEKKTPQEQMVGADYSGWMKKKSSSVLSPWKPRLFVLKGRRLSYYYSENDEEEKGLIDISFHRVLSADGDRLTGLHATLTGATNSPASPLDALTPTMASTDDAAEPSSTLSKSPNSDSMFIFKLVPPRPGLSRAVTFTKPTIHYFAVPNIKQGRLWMAALMKATIDRDETKAVTTTYTQKTIPLAKARLMKHRPPALMNLDEKVEEEPLKTPASDRNGLNIQGIVYDREEGLEDSGVSGVEKLPSSARGADSEESIREGNEKAVEAGAAAPLTA